MTRASNGKTVLRGRKRMRKLTKGFRAGRHHLYRQSVVTLMRGRRLRLPRSPRPQARVPPAVDRAHQRRLPDARPALRPAHLRPARAIVELDRKTLANLAIEDPDTFTKIVELARATCRPGSK